jgi:methanogenic corrinoid protein MtbC1
LAGFVRSKSLEVLDYRSIGLDSAGASFDSADSTAAMLTQALLSGDEQRSLQIMLNLYFGKHSLHWICDQVIAAAFHEIGDQWECGQAEIYQERRGCKIAQRMLNRLASLIPEPAANSPLAMGCSTEGDIYSLGSIMAELVLREAGWQASALGENLPLFSLAAAITRHQPKLVWVSCSHLQNPHQFVAEFCRLHQSFHSDVTFVIGGRALERPLLEQLRFATYCQTMGELHAFANKELARLQSMETA